jgi:hypothetical protein
MSLREFKAARQQLPEKNSHYIDAANLYFQKHAARMKELRNEFGGHLKASAIELATVASPRMSLEESLGILQTWRADYGWNCTMLMN